MRRDDNSTSNSSEEETSEDTQGLSRMRKMKTVDTSDPFSQPFREKSPKKNHQVPLPTSFAKKTWWVMDISSKFLSEDES